MKKAIVFLLIVGLALPMLRVGDAFAGEGGKGRGMGNCEGDNRQIRERSQRRERIQQQQRFQEQEAVQEQMSNQDNEMLQEEKTFQERDKNGKGQVE